MISSNQPQNDELHTLLDFPGPVLIYCWANWSVRCHTISPLIDQLSEEYKDRIKLVKVDIDRNPKLASRLGLLGINSVPIVFIFKSGELAEKIMGVASYEKFTEAVDKHLA
jgi:thioredoxin 1